MQAQASSVQAQQEVTVGPAAVQDNSVQLPGLSTGNHGTQAASMHSPAASAVRPVMMCDQQGEQPDGMLALEANLFTQDMVVADSDPEDEDRFLASCSQRPDHLDCADGSLHLTQPAAESSMGTDTLPHALSLHLSPMSCPVSQTLQEEPDACSAFHTECSSAVPLEDTLPDTGTAMALRSSSASLNASPVPVPTTLAAHANSSFGQQLHQEQQPLQQSSNAGPDSPTAQSKPGAYMSQEVLHDAAAKAEPLGYSDGAVNSNPMQQQLLKSVVPCEAVTSFLWAALRHIVPQAKHTPALRFQALTTIGILLHTFFYPNSTRRQSFDCVNCC